MVKKVVNHEPGTSGSVAMGQPAAGNRCEKSRTGQTRSAPSGCEAAQPERLSRRLARATAEPFVRAVARSLCREWGEDPDKMVLAHDPADPKPAAPVPQWMLFRDDAVTAITVFVVAEFEAEELHS